MNTDKTEPKEETDLGNVACNIARPPKRLPYR